MSIRNGKAREGAFDASQSSLDLYWKISDQFFGPIDQLVRAEDLKSG